MRTDVALDTCRLADLELAFELEVARQLSGDHRGSSGNRARPARLLREQEGALDAAFPRGDAGHGQIGVARHVADEFGACADEGRTADDAVQKSSTWRVR